MDDSIIEILKNNQLSITDNRLKILELFHKNGKALSHADIEHLSGKNFDRVTADNSIVYALCKETCSEGHHHDDHIHFICDKCGTMYCLEQTHVPSVNIPKGFSVEQVNVLVNGICKNCK